MWQHGADVTGGPAVKKLTVREGNCLHKWELSEGLPQLSRGECKEMELALAQLVVKAGFLYIGNWLHFWASFAKHPPIVMY